MKCVWNSKNKCSGVVKYHSLYCDQIRMPICKLHKAEAEAITISYRNLMKDLTPESIVGLK